MPKYAYFDSTKPSPQSIIGWYSDEVIYPNMPSAENLLELTDDQWNNRLNAVYQVNNGTLEVVPNAQNPYK